MEGTRGFCFCASCTQLRESFVGTHTCSVSLKHTRVFHSMWGDLDDLSHIPAELEEGILRTQDVS